MVRCVVDRPALLSWPTGVTLVHYAALALFEYTALILSCYTVVSLPTFTPSTSSSLQVIFLDAPSLTIALYSVSRKLWLSPTSSFLHPRTAHSRQKRPLHLHCRAWSTFCGYFRVCSSYEDPSKLEVRCRFHQRNNSI